MNYNWYTKTGMGMYRCLKCQSEFYCFSDFKQHAYAAGEDKDIQ